MSGQWVNVDFEERVTWFVCVWMLYRQPNIF